jgi:hypothetical protein
VLQNDNNDDIWKPLKIPQCVSESIRRCTGTKSKPAETQKSEPGLILYTVNHSYINFTESFLLNFLPFAGKNIKSSLALEQSLLIENFGTAALAFLTKTRLG